MNGSINPERQLADAFIRETRCHVFLTGKAGTGKTTFLHQLKQNAPKRMVVTAPTGVAAVNAGGVTLHSFFQLPFGPYLPDGDQQRQTEQRRFNREKIDIIKNLDLLVIDEISMVRADMLDAVDAVLRRYKDAQHAFGGVQLLMIGDLYQLSPVVKDDEWALLKSHYDSCYFFSSHALRQAELVSIELKKIYRQSDTQFIELLNRVRDNQLDQETLELLNTRYIPDFHSDDDYITLTTHNRSADECNEHYLQTLKSKAFNFPATIEGDFPPHSYPAMETLTLKEGAQVMFLRNDNATTKRYFNGKIGKITCIEDEYINVKCPDDDKEIIVTPVTWENIKYTLDAESGEIREAVIGTFTQYPLRPAWAITVHKSQGLTFERAVIDVNAAFSHGQVYVALSRCKTFEGLVLSTAISRNAVKTDSAVTQFTAYNKAHPASLERLRQAKIGYQQQMILECFNFQTLGNSIGKLTSQLRNQRHIVHSAGIDALEQITPQVIEKITQVGDKFQRQLRSLFNPEHIPEENPVVQERIQKASHYFTEKLHAELVDWTSHFSFSTDNSRVKTFITKSHKALRLELAIKTTAMESCRDGFATARYLQAITHAELDQQQRPRKQSKAQLDIAEASHPQLLQKLINWRTNQAADEQVKHFQVLHQRVLIQIAEDLPGNMDALKKINGVGKHTAQKYGDQLVTIVNDYCREHDIEAQRYTPPTPAKKRTDKDTKKVSYDLFIQGKTVEEIAAKRELNPSTIEGHLAHYVAVGELNIAEIVSAEKIKAIKQKLDALSKDSLKAIKIALGDDYSYGEIKLTLASLEFENGEKDS